MITEEQYKQALLVVQQYLLQIQSESDEETLYYYKKYSKLLGIEKKDNVFDYASTKLTNCLYYYRDELNLEVNRINRKLSLPISELSNLSLTMFKKTRNVGSKTVWELKAICYYAQVKLKP